MASTLTLTDSYAHHDHELSVTELEDERRWLEEARTGDPAAFAALYDRFAPELYRRVLLPKLGNHAEAEDALAETFQAFLKNLGELRVDDRSLWHWLARVASRKAVDQYRRRAREAQLPGFERLVEPLLEPELTEELSLKDCVRRCLSAINERYARAITLRFFEARSRQEAAAAMGVELGTFDVVLLRALRAFRKQWDALQSEEERADARR